MVLPESLMVRVTVRHALVTSAALAQSQWPTLRLSMPIRAVMTVRKMASGKRVSIRVFIVIWTSLMLCARGKASPKPTAPRS